MFVPQEQFIDNTFRKDIHSDSYTALQVGTVLKVNTLDDGMFRADTVNVGTDKGQQYINVPVATSKLFDNFSTNRVVLPLSNDNNRSSANIDLPTEGSRVIIGFIQGKGYYPVVMGCIQDVARHSQYSTGLSTKSLDGAADRKLYVHESRYWNKVDARGNYEESFPDGSSISISDTVTDDAASLSEGTRFDKTTPQPPKTIRIKHSSGATIRIDTDGTVHIGAGLDRKVILDGDNVQVNIPIGAVINGAVVSGPSGSITVAGVSGVPITGTVEASPATTTYAG